MIEGMLQEMLEVMLEGMLKEILERMFEGMLGVRSNARRNV